MKPLFIFLSIFFCFFYKVPAQQLTENMKSEKLEAMSRLSFMIGEWQGSGWFQMGNSPRESFQIQEKIEKKLDGLVYLVEGHGTTNGITTHHALALISWDLENASYHFESHTYDGRSVDAQGTIQGSTFIWGFPTPNGGRIRYKMAFENGQKWHETGAYSPDGENWYPFMEMTLTKTDH
jgi:hypothetical protein